MNGTAIATLQYYTPGVHNVLTNVVMSAFLLGQFTPSLPYSSSTGLSLRPSDDFRFPNGALNGVCGSLDPPRAMHFGFALAHSVGYVRLLDNSVAALTSESSSIQTGSAHFGDSARTTAYVISLVLAINVPLGDAIVWWRVCVLWRNKSIIALGVVLIAGTFGFGILSTIHWPRVQANVDMQPLMSYGDVYGGVSGLLSMVTNVTATSLIGRKAWEHRAILRQGPGASKGRWNTPTMRVLVLLVESGTAYCIILGVALTNNIVSRSKAASLTPSGAAFISVTTVFLSGCFVPVLAIYPTVIVFIVAVNRSLIDRTLANAGSPSAIPSHILPSMVFRNSSATIDIPPSAVHHDIDSPGDSAIRGGGTSTGDDLATAEDEAPNLV